MPEEEFRRIATLYGASNIAIAAHFNVSEKAIEIRKKDLGL